MPFLVAVPMLVVVVAFAALGVAAMQPQTSSAFTSWLRSLPPVARFVIGTSADVAMKLTRWVTHKIGETFMDVERLAVGWVGGLADWAGSVVGMALLWPVELFRLQTWLIWHGIPDAVRALVGAAAKVVHAVVPRVQKVERIVVKLPRLSKAQAQALVSAAVATYIGPYLFPLRWLRNHFHALTAVLPHTLPLHLPRTIANILKRLRKLDRVTAGGLAVGAVAMALGRLGVGWVRCSKVGRVGRRLCGMNEGVLDDLLLGTLPLLSFVSVVEIAKAMQQVTPAVTAATFGNIRETAGTFSSAELTDLLADARDLLT